MAQRDRAIYMRAYRQRRRAAVVSDLLAAQARIRELEDEVHRLTTALGRRPAETTFNSRPFTPVPKVGR